MTTPKQQPAPFKIGQTVYIHNDEYMFVGRLDDLAAVRRIDCGDDQPVEHVPMVQVFDTSFSVRWARGEMK